MQTMHIWSELGVLAIEHGSLRCGKRKAHTRLLASSSNGIGPLSHVICKTSDSPEHRAHACRWWRGEATREALTGDGWSE